MTTLEKLPGSPATLKSEVSKFAGDVAAIDEAIELLSNTSSQLVGAAASELYGRNLDAVIQMEDARDRYEGTANALRTYVVEMEAAHTQADAALDEAPAAITERDHAQSSVEWLRRAVTNAEANGVPTSEVTRLENQLYLARRREARADTALGDIESRWLAAKERQESAAATAAAQIKEAMDETNNSVLDNIGAFFSWIGDGLAALGTWLVDALKAIGEFLMQYAGLLLVVLVVAALLLIVTSLTVVGALVLAVLIVAALAAVLTAISLSTDSSGFFPGEDYPTEVRDADPERDGERPVDPSYESVLDDLERVDRGTKDRPLYGPDGEFLGWEPRDDMASTIKVVALRDEDTGEIVGWRVQIPSTQDWGLSGNSLNDLPTNVLHALVPGRETSMEQAVWDAMQRAGVMDSDAPVMLAGWSQGGMTAAEIAIDPRMSGREMSLVTGGSPMDQYRHELSQQGARVTAFTHPDGVSGLEGVRLGIADLANSDPNFVQHFEWKMAHDAGSYADQASRLQPDLRAGDEVFFANFGEGIVEEFTWFEYTRNDPNAPPPPPPPTPTPSPRPAPTPPPSTGGG